VAVATVLGIAALFTAGAAPAAAVAMRLTAVPAPGAGATVHHTRLCASVRRATKTTIVVPVVVDRGGPSDQPEVSCVSVPAGSTDAQVLSARAKLLGRIAPRYAISGLLCGIDGYPATGCGQQSGSRYAYWAYFHGGSTWTYASVGPASWTVAAGDVEGWRYEPEGSATPADPPPRSPSDVSALCPASVPPTTTTTPTGPAPTTVPSTTLPSTGPSGGRGPGTQTPAPASSPASSSVSSGPKPFVAGPGTIGTSAAGTGAGTTTSAPPASGATGRVSSSTSRQPTPTRLASKRGPEHGGVPAGVIGAVVLIVLLATAAVIRTRRVSRSE